MKLYQILLLALVVSVCFMINIVEGRRPWYDYNNDDFTVTATTHTSTMLIGKTFGRIYFLAVNEAQLYDVRLATYPITVPDLERTNRGRLLQKNLGWWEDKYNIYTSSYWVIISSKGCGATVTPIEADVTGTQRY